ncbi:hypothetical protein ACFRQM_05955 [Streptomyces sp. NPDC056831]|uniref:hypothetical protein n=1 Tax=Streptomyces sp. NPDC056831 TaxID=3345954 RepID=UPI00369CB96F
MKRFPRIAAAAVAAAALVGIVVPAQTAAAAAPARAGSEAFEFLGASGTPSPNDIVMHWRGTCELPGERVRVLINKDGAPFAHVEAACKSDHTFTGRSMRYDYERWGLEFGKSFNYEATWFDTTIRHVKGSAVLKWCDFACWQGSDF